MFFKHKNEKNPSEDLKQETPDQEQVNEQLKQQAQEALKQAQERNVSAGGGSFPWSKDQSETADPDMEPEAQPESIASPDSVGRMDLSKEEEEKNALMENSSEFTHKAENVTESETQAQSVDDASEQVAEEDCENSADSETHVMFPVADNGNEDAGSDEVDQESQDTESEVETEESSNDKFNELIQKEELDDDDMVSLQAEIDALKKQISEQIEQQEQVQKNTEYNALETRSSAKKAKVALIIAIIVALLCVGIGIFAWIKVNSPVENTTYETQTVVQEKAQEDIDSSKYKGEEHTHAWESNMVTVEAPELTKQIEHPAEYTTQEVKHTVCNTCHQIVDSATAEHTAETGHTGFTTNVPVSEQVVSKEAWSETVVVQQYQSKTVQNGEKCRICGVLRGEKSYEALMAELGFKEKVDE